MATYFQTPFGNKYYVEVKAPKMENVTSNIICCVDVSGSMSGEPINNVCEILRDIYRRTKIEYPLMCYGTSVKHLTIKAVEHSTLPCVEGTNFCVIFDAIKQRLLKEQKDVTFIFMTDGQHMYSQTDLQKSMQALRLVMSALKSLQITIHVIGFGSVNGEFLEQVRKLGNKEGLLRYSTKSVDLQDNFSDLFDYATARECSIKVNGKVYTANSNDENIGFLVDATTEDQLKDVQIKFNTTGDFTPVDVEPMTDVRSIHMVRALNLHSPDNEDDVRKFLTALNGISPSGHDLMERLEVDQIKKEINARMMEYISLFTQIKMGQVPEQVKLKLSALRHDATFSNLQRKKKLDLRVNKNVEYFKKTDIQGILEGFKRKMTPSAWEEIKRLKNEYICDYSGMDIYEIMQKSPDNVLCLGVLVKREENAIDSPTGLTLLSVSSTLISFDAFIEAMNATKMGGGEGGSFSDFSDINEEFCIIGSRKERINAVIPLYIHEEHFKRVRILEGLWLGYLYTLDSYGYHKSQEIALLKLFYDMITQHVGTPWYSGILQNIEKVCQFIINESEGFKSEYGGDTWEKFVQSIHGRSSTYDPVIPLMIGHLKGELERTVKPVYFQYLRQHIRKNHRKNGEGILNRLLYGNVETTISVAAPPLIKVEDCDPDYVERTYMHYFDDKGEGSALIPETFTGKHRKPIVNTESEMEYIKSLLIETPTCLKTMLAYAYPKLPDTFVQDTMDYDLARKEIVMALFFDKDVPNHVTYDNVLAFVDDKLQGNTDHMIKYDTSAENVAVIAHVANNFKTVKGFAGLLKKYAPKRCGVFFDAVVDKILSHSWPAPDYEVIDTDEGDVKISMMKIIALLRNEFDDVDLDNKNITRTFYGNLVEQCWQPLVDIERLREFIGEDVLDKIERENLDKGCKVVHCYRKSNVPNRHGHSNHNPNKNDLFPFVGYDKPQ